MEKMEIRQFDLAEFRYDKADNGDTIVRGYAAVFGSLSEDLGGFKEKINNRAFDNVLDDDVVALLNHDNNIVFGRTSSGTLKLSVDERGLVSEIKMPNTTVTRPAYPQTSVAIRSLDIFKNEKPKFMSTLKNKVKFLKHTK